MMLDETDGHEHRPTEDPVICPAGGTVRSAVRQGHAS